MGGNRNSLKDGYVDLKVNKDVTEKEVRVRLIGMPYAFMQYQAKTYNQELGKREDKDFPDADEKSKFTRNWISPDDVDDRYPVDPWARDGYTGSLRYAQNVLVRNDDDTFEVKILEKGKMLFDQFTDAELMNQRRNEKSGKNYVTNLGGAKSHDILIVAEFNKKKPLVADLKVAIEPEYSEITEEEIAALKAVGAPTDEEYEELIARNPGLEELPKWFLYGYQLHRIYKPDLHPDMIEGEATTSKPKTSRGELDMSNTESDDDDAETAPAAKSVKSGATATATKPAAKVTAKPAKAEETEEEEESAFDSETEASDDW
jgi:hypothetical protein